MTTTATTRKTPKTWTHAEIAQIVSNHHAGQPGYPTRFSAAEYEAKMIELGLIDAPEKPRLDGVGETRVEDLVAKIVDAGGLREPYVTLSVRYAIKLLQAHLPKRAPKDAVPF